MSQLQPDTQAQLPENPKDPKKGASGKKPNRSKKTGTEGNQVRYPWIPLAVSRKLISTLLVITILLGASCAILVILVFGQLSKEPWVLVKEGGQYFQSNLSRTNVTRDDVELFLGDIIPKLLGSVEGEAPALNLLQSMVNPNILSEQREKLQSQSATLKSQKISQFAIVTGIVPDTLVIDRSKKFVYAEALGIVTLTRQDKSTPSQVQWRCLLYIVDPTASLQRTTPMGQIQGNRYGLYLQQIEEQPRGTVNPDAPQPTTRDEQERREQEMRRQTESIPSLSIE